MTANSYSLFSYLTAHNGGHLVDGKILPDKEVRAWHRNDTEAEMVQNFSKELVGERSDL